eukprot:6206310-Pleurochrysis_carterae.AAC.1
MSSFLSPSFLFSPASCYGASHYVRPYRISSSLRLAFPLCARVRARVCAYGCVRYAHSLPLRASPCVKLLRCSPLNAPQLISDRLHYLTAPFLEGIVPTWPRERNLATRNEKVHENGIEMQVHENAFAHPSETRMIDVQHSWPSSLSLRRPSVAKLDRCLP